MNVENRREQIVWFGYYTVGVCIALILNEEIIRSFNHKWPLECHSNHVVLIVIMRCFNVVSISQNGIELMFEHVL